MKWTTWQSTLVLFGCFLAGSISLDAAPGEKSHDKNLIRNGGFEEATEEGVSGKFPLEWKMRKYNTLKEGEFVLDDKVKHKGSYSVKFTNATHGLLQDVSVKEGERYDFSYFVKTNLIKGGAGFSIRWLNADGKLIFRQATESEKTKSWISGDKVQITHNSNRYGVTDWRKAELSGIRVPETAVTARISIRPVFGVKGEFWVDDLVMEPVATEEVTGELKSLVTKIGRAHV